MYVPAHNQDQTKGFPEIIWTSASHHILHPTYIASNISQKTNRSSQKDASTQQSDSQDTFRHSVTEAKAND